MKTASEIAAMLAQRCESVCRELLPDGRIAGSEYEAADVSGSAGKSLKVCLRGDKAGVWCDFAAGAGGDLLDLWAAVRGVSLAEAIREAKGYLGVTEIEFEPRKRREYARPDKPRCQRPKFGSPVWSYLTGERKLSAEVLERYRIGELAGGVIAFPCLRDGDLVNCKYLGIERTREGKKITRLEPGAELCLFGWQAIPANARNVVLAEGEIDALTLAMQGCNALSVPNGAAGQTWLENEFDRLAQFDQIWIAMDNDEPGQKAAMELIERLGRHRCRLVQWPEGVKDANDALQQGWTLERFAGVIMSARTLDPSELKNAGAFAAEVVEEFYPSGDAEAGLRTPWARFGENLIFRPGELTVWTGYNGQGKSALIGHVLVDGLAQGQRFCVASMELRPRKLLKWFVKQASGMDRPQPDAIEETIAWLGDGLWLFDLLGTAKTERLLEVFGYARRRYRIQHFVVDSLMKCGIAEDDYAAQKAFCERLIDFAHESDCHVHLVAHARKGRDELEAPGKMDVKGTGAITDLADNVLSVWRNKAKAQQIEDLMLGPNDPVPVDLVEKPDASLIVHKQRYSGWEGKCWLWFDSRSMQFAGLANDPPVCYVGHRNQASGEEWRA